MYLNKGGTSNLQFYRKAIKLQYQLQENLVMSEREHTVLLEILNTAHEIAM